MKKGKIIIGLLFAAVILFFYLSGIGEYITLGYLKSRLNEFLDYYESHKLLVIAVYGAVYVLFTAFSLPGAVVLTLAGGAIFGVLTGTLVVSLSSTTGATLAFIGARYMFRDWIEKKYRGNIAKFSEGIAENGFSYLLFLRLVPIFPFFIINVVMGLTRVDLKTYVLASWIGMLPGTFVFIYAGAQLSGIDSIGSVMSGRVLLAFLMLGILALLPIFYKKTRWGENKKK
ncbi:MAG: TVP38/TMEM64 family protein [Proteobacteria bacterium]|nr:TVP38/TMEM64 family protein [Pseudomonadota bacterium]